MKKKVNTKQKKYATKLFKKPSMRIRFLAKTNVTYREKVHKNQILSSKICKKNKEYYHCKSDFEQKHM